MKTLDEIALTTNQKLALSDLKKKLEAKFDITEIAVFGSIVRGEADNESDLDLLIVTQNPMQRSVRHLITDIVCEINSNHDTNLSTLVVDKTSWETGLYSVLPIHEEILKEGVVL
jgi:predicted nucleotidyltransferase